MEPRRRQDGARPGGTRRAGGHQKGTMKTLLAALWAALAASAALAAEPAIPLPASWALAAVDEALPPPRPPKPDLTREIEERKSHAIPAAEIVGFDFLLNQFDRHFIGDEYRSNLRSIRRNLHSS